MNDSPSDPYSDPLFEPIMQRLLETGKEHEDFLYGVQFRCLEALASVDPVDQQQAWKRVHDFIEEYQNR